MEQSLSEMRRPLPFVSESPRLMSPATTAAVHAAVEHYAERGVLDSRLRPAARLVCADARACDLRVEQMLIALKNEWNAILELRRVPHGAARADLTSRFITLCIHAFYEGQPSVRGSDMRPGDGAPMRV